MNPILRPATASDAEAVAQVHIASREAFTPFAPLAHSHDEVRQWVRDTLLKNDRVTVAEVEGNVVAIVATRAEPDATWITMLYALPGWTGRGIGARLLDHALDYAARPVRLWTFHPNAGARRFYERHGFIAIEFTDGRSNEERCPDVLYELAAG